jgi:pyruvate dehydrogenase E1 component alpha subunit
MGLSYDMPSKWVDGMTCEEVHNAMDEAVERARKGEGPTFLEIRTYRYRGHSMSDPAKYRTKEEVEQYKSQDPIEKVKETILKNSYLTEAQLEEIDNNIKDVVNKSVEFAESSPWPDASELFTDVYTDTQYPFLID